MERIACSTAIEASVNRLEDVALNALFDVYPRPRPAPRIDDPVYYRFLHALAPQLNNFLELGCRTGAASYHVAQGNPKTKIHCIDRKDRMAVYHPNISFHLCDTRDAGMPKYLGKKFDAIFVDSEHTYEQVRAEYDLWRPRVRDGGVMLFDDIDEYEGLQKFWTELPGNKFSVPQLHPERWGFGILFC